MAENPEVLPGQKRSANGWFCKFVDIGGTRNSKIEQQDRPMYDWEIFESKCRTVRVSWSVEDRAWWWDKIKRETPAAEVSTFPGDESGKYTQYPIPHWIFGTAKLADRTESFKERHLGSEKAVDTKDQKDRDALMAETRRGFGEVLGSVSSSSLREESHAVSNPSFNTPTKSAKEILEQQTPTKSREGRSSPLLITFFYGWGFRMFFC